MKTNTLALAFIPLFCALLATGCCHVNHLSSASPPKAVVVESNSSATLDVELTRRRCPPSRSVMGPIARASVSEFRILSELQEEDPAVCIPFLNKAVLRVLGKRLGWNSGESGDLLRIQIQELRLVASDPLSPFVVVGSIRASIERGDELLWRACLEFEMPPGGGSVKNLSQLPPDLRRKFWKRVSEHMALVLLQQLERDLGPKG